MTARRLVAPDRVALEGPPLIGFIVAFCTSRLCSISWSAYQPRHTIQQLFPLIRSIGRLNLHGCLMALTFCNGTVTA